MEPSTFETSFLKEADVSVNETGTFNGLGGYKKVVVDMAISFSHENKIGKAKKHNDGGWSLKKMILRNF
jgi:hypothetical protein